MKATKHSRCMLYGFLCAGALYWPLQASATALAPETGVIELFGTTAVQSEVLESSRGGADLSVSQIRSDGAVHDNLASNLTTGNNLLTEGSFAGASGFPTVVQNSGNNVLIQNSTIINLQVQ